MKYGHTTVLLQESIDGLKIEAGDTYVDGTLGSGGHAEEVIKRFGPTVKIVGIDMDAAALERTNERLGTHSYVKLVVGNFRTMDTLLNDLGIENVQRIMLDLGLSSNQIDESGRGFSFQKDEPLMMTFSADPAHAVTTAETVVNEWSQETLETILKGFGEERYARSIARAIVQTRAVHAIKTTGELVAIISAAVPGHYRRGRLHYATRTFQAIRIAVNDELGALSEGLHAAWKKLSPGGRMAVISFHSLEDRIVKHFFRSLADEDVAVLITKRPLVATEEESHNNRRSRSAKLRIIEKK